MCARMCPRATPSGCARLRGSTSVSLADPDLQHALSSALIAHARAHAHDAPLYYAAFSTCAYDLYRAAVSIRRRIYDVIRTGFIVYGSYHKSEYPIPLSFLTVPTSVWLPHPAAFQRLGRQ